MLWSHLQMAGECYKSTNVIHFGFFFFIKINYTGKGWRRSVLSVVYEKNMSRLWWIHKLSNSKYKMMNLRHTHTHTLHRQAHIHMRMCTHLPTLNTAFSGKESACQYRRGRFNPWVGKIPWRSKWQPTPVFLPGKSHGHRSLASELITTESCVKCE